MASDCPSGPAPASPATFGAILLVCLLVTAVATHVLTIVFGVYDGPEHPLSIPAVWTILALLGANAVMLAVGRRHLPRAQILALAFGTLLAAPLMTQGFWHRFVGTVTAFPRENQFRYIDALPDRLWPHGANLLAAGLPAGDPRPVAEGSPLELAVPVGGAGAIPGQPYLVSALVRAGDLPEGSRLTCSLVGADGADTTVFQVDRPTRPDAVRNDGFQRFGLYGVRIPEAVGSVRVRFAFTGGGGAQVADGRLMSVAGVEGLLRGTRPATREVRAALPADQRATTREAPPSLLSSGGPGFVASGGIPWDEWAVCLAAWAAFFVLLMGACLSITLLLRRHWIEAERLPLPLGRGLGMLLGGDGQATVWRNRWFWGGLAVALLWCQARYWSAHVPSLPDPSIAIPLKPYFSDPGWGRMWEVTFAVNAIFVGIALFFELNILASLVVGYWLFRSLYWLGDATGMSSDPAYPWRHDIGAGSYLAYFAVIMVLARRHLADTARRALAGGWRAGAGEVVAPRTGLLLLLACLAGAAAWCAWVGIEPLGFAVLFAALLVIAVVAARVRAECGVLFGYFTPYSMGIVLGSLGGIPVFGPQAVLFGLLASMWMTSCTMHIPGLQVDWVEAGRGQGIGPVLLVLLPILAVGAGLVVAGWAFLTLGYGQGGDNLGFPWAFDSKIWYFGGFTAEVGSLGQDKASVFSFGGIGLGAAATTAVAALRQLIAGFWLHPIGILLSTSHMMDWGWGCCLVALAIRFGVVRVAGAEAVRGKLLPAGLGIFLAGALTYLASLAHGGALLAAGGAPAALMRGIP